MKTRQVPVIIMLIAGLMTSIAAIINHMETTQFLKILIVVLIIFYIVGCVIKVVLDKNFKEEVEEAATEEAAEEETTEEAVEQEDSETEEQN